MLPSILILAAVTLQRLYELWLSERHTRALLARGGFEAGRGHYPTIVALHAAWLGAIWLLGWDKPVSWPWLTVFAVLQLLRIWVMRALGERWTTRIVVLPGAPLVTRGPYRFTRHPNYWVVAAETAVLPLAFALPEVAVAFTVLNALVLLVRMRAEEAALEPTETSLPGGEG
ncbi:MAG TPA: isoprenylcysteine carboxylmethyltransferase family protein [Caulobacteraceae bacterium]|jgi:methyltransferase